MKKLTLLAYVMAMALLWGCSSCPDELAGGRHEEEGIEQVFTIRYQVRGEWYPLIGNLGIYPHDSVKLYSEKGERLSAPDFYIDSGGIGRFIFANLNTPRGKDIIQTYYLYLSYQRIDTLRHEFRLNKDFCDPLFAYGRFYHNNNLITQKKDDDYIPAASIEQK